MDAMPEDIAIRPGTINREQWFGICENCECWGPEAALEEASAWVASHRQHGGHIRRLAA